MGYVHACSGYPESSLARERDERSVGGLDRCRQWQDATRGLFTAAESGFLFSSILPRCERGGYSEGSKLPQPQSISVTRGRAVNFGRFKRAQGTNPLHPTAVWRAADG